MPTEDGMLNLEDLMKNEASSEIKNELEIVQQAVQNISPDERKKIDSIKESINIQDSNAVLAFGSAAQNDIATFTDGILSSVRAKDSGPVGELLGELVSKTRELKPESERSFLTKIPIIKNFVNKGQSLMDRYDKLSSQVDMIQAQLEKNKMDMMKDIAMFDELFKQNITYFRNLNSYIIAGEEKIKEMHEVTLPRLRQQAIESNDQMSVQAVNDFEQNLERFEKKIHDLKLSKTISLQTAPQIRLMSNTNRDLVEKIQIVSTSSIPIWKGQMVIALGLARQKQVLAMNRAVNDTTNEMLKRNAELLKMNTIETAKESQRGIVDLETLKKANEDIITTIEETIKIQQSARSARQNAEKELVAIEDRLKQTLLKSANR